MFQVASQQNWPYVMWDAMRSVGQVRGGHAVWCSCWRQLQSVPIMCFEERCSRRAAYAVVALLSGSQSQTGLTHGRIPLTSA